MLSIRRLRRRGATLIELLVALLVGGIVLGTVVSIGIRQQRLYGDIGRRVMGQAQLRHAGAILPIDVRAASVADSDIPGAEARDTSLEIRATLASSIVCEAAGATLLLAGAGGDADFAFFADQPRRGDTLWLLDESTADERWRALPVLRASTSGRPCALARSGAGAFARLTAPPLIVDTGEPDAASFAPGTPARLTRRVRYSFYPAADGHWYLGFRDWNGALDRFNLIQPVSGPFLPPSAGVGFRYFDGAGEPLPPDVPAASPIARVEIVLRAAGASTLGAARWREPRMDSSVVAVALRNRW